MVQAKGSKPPIGVVFDGAVGESIDAMLGLAVLYGLRAGNELRVASLSVSEHDPRAASLCDAIARYYVPSPRGAALIGMATGAQSTGGAMPMAEAVLGKRNADGKPRYPRVVEKWKDTADVAALMRNGMSAQQPENGAVVVAGPLTNLAAALALPDTTDYIKARIRSLAIAANESDIKKDLAAARKVLGDWPGPVVFASAELATLVFPGSTLDQRFAATPDHPIADAYRAFHTMPYDAPLTAGAAVFYSAHPDSPLFKLSEPGTITLLDDGKTRFTPGTQGRHRMLLAAPGQTEAAIKTLADLPPKHPVQNTGGRGQL